MRAFGSRRGWPGFGGTWIQRRLKGAFLSWKRHKQSGHPLLFGSWQYLSLWVAMWGPSLCDLAHICQMLCGGLAGPAQLGSLVCPLTALTSCRCWMRQPSMLPSVLVQQRPLFCSLGHQSQHVVTRSLKSATRQAMRALRLPWPHVDTPWLPLSPRVGGRTR